MPALGFRPPDVATRWRGGGGVAPPLLTAPLGFYPNGSANPIWSAAVAALLGGGSSRVTAMMVGDSTTAGRGGGSGGTEWIGAAANRPARWVADRLMLAGIVASHQSFHGDYGLAGAAAGVTLPQFFPAVDLGGWSANGWNVLPGGAYLTPGATLSFTTTGANRWRISAFDAGAATWTILIDGQPPTVGGSTMTPAGDNNGFTEAVFGVASVGTHSISIASAGGGTLNGIIAFADTGGVDIVTNAVSGATTATRAATDGNYAALNFIRQVAPAVTIINLGLNDMYGGAPISTYTANLQTIITAAKASGDILLMFPHPAGGAFNTNVAAFHAAARQVAVTNGIAFFSLNEFEGGVFASSAMQDAVVHPTVATYRRYHTATGVALLKMAGL